MKVRNKGADPARPDGGKEILAGKSRVTLIHKVALVLLAILFYFITTPSRTSSPWTM